MRKISVASIIISIFCTWLFISSVTAANIRDEITNAISSTGQELKTEEAKALLLQAIQRFYKIRITRHLLQYEGSKEFSESYMISYNVFRDALYKEDLTIVPSKISSNVINEMVDSYNKYSELFKMYQEMDKNFGSPKDRPPYDSLRAQIYFSIILNVFAKNQWEIARKFTHIFPFCE